MKPYEIIVNRLRDLRAMLQNEIIPVDRKRQQYCIYVSWIDGYIFGITQGTKGTGLTLNTIDLYHAYLQTLRETYLK